MLCFCKRSVAREPTRRSPRRGQGQVIFVNCVGADRYGAAIVEKSAQAGIDVQHVFTETDVLSGTALIMIGDGGDNYLSGGAGGEL